MIVYFTCLLILTWIELINSLQILFVKSQQWYSDWTRNIKSYLYVTYIDNYIILSFLWVSINYFYLFTGTSSNFKFLHIFLLSSGGSHAFLCYFNWHISLCIIFHCSRLLICLFLFNIYIAYLKSLLFFGL
jgi:hypothetical protein